jgi:hypothetical protein
MLTSTAIGTPRTVMTTARQRLQSMLIERRKTNRRITTVKTARAIPTPQEMTQIIMPTRAANALSKPPRIKII